MNVQTIRDTIARARPGWHIRFRYRISETENNSASEWTDADMVVITPANDEGNVTIAASTSSKQRYVLPHQNV